MLNIRIRKEGNKMKKMVVITFILCIITLGLSIASFVMSCDKKEDSEEKTEAAVAEPETDEDIQYVLYLGTNDKDTNEPVFEPDESKEQLKKILIDHFGGYTIQEATG